MKKLSVLSLLLIIVISLVGCGSKSKNITYQASQNAKQAVLYINNFESLTDIQTNLEKLKDISSPDFYSKNSDIEAYRKFEGYTQKSRY